MTRHWLAFAAATAFAGFAAPALAQDDGPPPAWTDPQAPDGPDFHGGPYAPGVQPMPGAVYPGAPFARPLPPGAMPPSPAPYPGGPMPYPPGPMAWHGGPGPVGPGYAYGYPYGPGPAPCGCGGGYTVTWVPIRIETRYRYSPAVRHEREIVEEHVVSREVVETKTVPVRRETKYVKPAPAKLTKGKVVRSTK
jgi:hypothetical protein